MNRGSIGGREGGLGMGDMKKRRRRWEEMEGERERRGTGSGGAEGLFLCYTGRSELWYCFPL